MGSWGRWSGRWGKNGQAKAPAPHWFGRVTKEPERDEGVMGDEGGVEGS